MFADVLGVVDVQPANQLIIGDLNLNDAHFNQQQQVTLLTCMQHTQHNTTAFSLFQFVLPTVQIEQHSNDEGVCFSQTGFISSVTFAALALVTAAAITVVLYFGKYCA